MWNPSSSWQKRTRIVAGGIVALCLLAAIPVLQLTAPSEIRPLQRTVEALPALLDRDERMLAVTLRGGSPADAGMSLEGLPVYAQGEDGRGVLVGRMVEGDRVLLPPRAVAACRDGGCELLYALPVRELDAALAVLLAPEGLDGELARARERLFPVLEDTLLARMNERLDDTLAELVRDLPKEHGEALQLVGEDVKLALERDGEVLIGRLSDRAWDVIGFWGITAGVMRVTGGKLSRWWSAGSSRAMGFFGFEGGEEEAPRRSSFLSERNKQELRMALELELERYWTEHGDRILADMGEILSKHSSSTLTELKTAWLERLQEDVLEASWEETRTDVVRAISAYGRDLAERRLITPRGEGRDEGPTLPLAYAIRSAARITRGPLLVLQQSPPAQSSMGQADPNVLEMRPYEITLDASRSMADRVEPTEEPR